MKYYRSPQLITLSGENEQPDYISILLDRMTPQEIEILEGDIDSEDYEFLIEEYPEFLGSISVAAVTGAVAIGKKIFGGIGRRIRARRARKKKASRKKKAASAAKKLHAQQIAVQQSRMYQAQVAQMQKKSNQKKMILTAAAMIPLLFLGS